MGMIYRLDEVPILAEVLDSGDTVTVAIYNKATGATVPLDTNSASEIGSTGIYRYTVDMTTPPEWGKNTYVYVFTGALQKRYGEFNWNDDDHVFNGAITIDTVNGSPGTKWPRGSRTDPSDNITDAKTIADRYNIKGYEIRGSVILNAAHPDWEFHGMASAQVATVDVGGQNINGSFFERITIKGAIGGSLPKKLTAVDFILDTVTGWDGIGTNGGIHVSLALEAGPGATCQLDNVASLTFGGVTVNANGLNQIQWGGATGVIIITGFTGGGLLQMAAEAAIVTLDAGNVGGVATLGGFMNLSNVSAMTIFLDETLNRQVFRNVMKLAPSAGAPAAGSVDEHLDTIITAIALLNDLSIADVQTALDNQGLTTSRAAMIELAKKMLINRLELADGSTNNWVLYDDDDTTPLLTFSVTDKLGAGIFQPPLMPSRRTRGV